MLAAKRNLNKGFTLVELLITISIFVILTGVVLFSQSKFNSSILLTNLAYDTAVTLRQAQTYGINIKEFNTGSGAGKFSPYGVHFDKSALNSFILFADLDDINSDGRPEGNGVYDGATSTCQAKSVDPSVKDGCVNRYNIKQGNYIVDLCKGDVALGIKTCSSNESINKLDIVFKRPDPDAHMRSDTATNPEYTIATIILGNPDQSVRKVRVRSNGLIEVIN